MLSKPFLDILECTRSLFFIDIKASQPRSNLLYIAHPSSSCSSSLSGVYTTAQDNGQDLRLWLSGTGGCASFVLVFKSEGESLKVGKEELLYTASLAKLKVEHDDLSLAAEELAGILGYFQQLAEVDTEGVEPTTHPTRNSSAPRIDESGRPLERDVALSTAPETDGEHFIVPRVL